ncbi:hypothetical protein VNI00_010216 [Paramarasmius palmivorus]|uniref:Glycoside hydrolase family 76 protein n=1 Tax=Paramarasmius palmivorus TaxID=297713 RepID=A0AAW0CH79_9AGAR
MWRKPQITFSLTQRMNYANVALNNAIGMLDSNLAGEIGSALNLHAIISEMDYITNQTKYKNEVTEFFSRYPHVSVFAQTLKINLTVVNKAMFGRAAIHAYMAYQDERFLNAASDAWDSVRQYALLRDDIESNRSIDQNIHLSCYGESMAGGTFNEMEGPNFFGWETGLFFTLSGLLYEISSNSTYMNAAVQSGDFIWKHLYRAPGLILELIDARSCNSPTQDFKIHLSGFWIEGLSILLSSSGNSSVFPLLQQSIVAATNQIGISWQQDNGVQGNDEVPFRNGFLIRGLRTAYQRLNTSNSDLKNYIQLYLGVQYNALLDLATQNHSNMYAGKWSGPAPLNSDLLNQTAASEVLIAGILIQSIQNSSTPTPKQPHSQPMMPPNRDTKQPIGAIVGGTVGGGIGLAGLFITFFVMYHRHQQKEPGLLSPFQMGAEQDAVPDVDRKLLSGEASTSGIVPRSHMGDVSIEDMVGVVYDRINSESRPRGDVSFDDLVRAVYDRINLQGLQEAPPSYRPTQTAVHSAS